jgi:FKBP-type peptidyl-prolyl cis-trans isomerase FkpA
VAATAAPCTSPSGSPIPNPQVSGVAKVGPDDFNATGCEVVTADGLTYIDLVVGTGAEVKSGTSVNVNYTGWLTNGTKFDSSRDSNRTPFQLTVGGGQVIKGWDEGLQGMKVGGRRKLIIPPSLGYGDRGAGGVIPPGATLVFIVEIVSAG